MMRHTPWHEPPVRRPLAIPCDLPADWTPAQALAVLEFLDDRRERLTAHYAFPLTEALRERQRLGAPHDDEDDADNAPL